MSHQSLINLTNTHVNWLDYIKLSTGINNFLRSNCINNPSPPVRPIIPLYLKPILKNRKGSKDFYNIFRNVGSIPIKATPKWNRDLELTFSDQNCKFQNKPSLEMIKSNLNQLYSEHEVLSKY